MKKNLMDYKVVDIFIGNVIKDRRLEKKIGLVEMAKKLGTYKQRYSNFETGSRSFPLDMYKEVCKILDINPVELLSGSMQDS